MIRVMSRFAKLPIAAFVRSGELFVDAMKDFQAIAERGIDALASALATRRAGAWNRAALQIRNHASQEVTKMADQDLGGDDLKYVSYSILFTKRDVEASLEKEQHAVVNYSTDGGSFGALKIAEFMQKVGKGQVTRPDVWRESNYPPGAVDDKHWTIPAEDLKYINFVYSVDRRLPRQETEYAKDQVRVLREIRDRL